MKKLNTKRYFAASNTSDGFVSYYDRIFGKLDRLFVIKGGPGTGKSSFMRTVGERAEKRGEDVEYFYCSFDPDSLDGLIINGKCGVLDGTEPHVFEPRIPGAVDVTVDLSRFWNREALEDNKEMLRELNEEKKRCFKLTYVYLSAIGKIAELNRSCLEACIKRNRFIDKIRAVSPKEALFAATPQLRLTSAFGRKGSVDLSSYVAIAEKSLLLSDSLDTLMASDLMMATMKDSKQKRMLKYYSYAPLEKCKPNALMLSNDTAIVVSNDGGDFDVSDFMSRDLINFKPMLRENREIKNTLLACAEKQFKKAAELHSEIEKIYISAMDFDAKEKFTDEVAEKLIFC